MKVALYYPWIYLTSGAERLLAQLSGRSRHQWTMFTNRFEPEHTFPELGSRDVVELKRISVDRNPTAAALGAWTIWRQRLPLEGYDALVVVCEGLGDLIVFRNHSVPVMNICLTPLRIVFDPVYRSRHMEKQGRLRKLAIDAGSALFRAVDRRAWKYYRRVYCISKEALTRARAGGLGDAANQEVLHLGLGFEPEAPSSRFEPFFLIPGRIMWTKNIELGIQAFHHLRNCHPEFEHFRLVIAGIVDRKSQAYVARLRELAAGDRHIEFCESPNDRELAALYSDCYTVLFTPFNEDWGLVPIEAMAFGKPVIAVNRGGPTESVEHGKTGFLEEPEPGRFAARMAELAANPAQAREIGLAGHHYAARYSWNAYTGRIDDEIERMVREEKSGSHAWTAAGKELRQP